MSGTSSRMLKLLSLLQSRRDWPGQVLAERLDVTARTVRRDVDRLRGLGYSIAAVKGPDGGYRLAPGSELPPLLFDDEQAVAIAVALQSAPSSGVDLDDAAARALTTVKQVMPSRLRHRIEGIRFTDAGASARVDPAVLQAVSTAAGSRRILRFDYGEDESHPPRRVEPHSVVARRGRWYLIAWDLDQNGWRIYRLDKMTPKTPAGAAFVPRPIPSGDAGTFLAARLKGSDDGDRWAFYGELLVELPASAIAPWLGDGELEQVSDTACRVRVGSWSWAGLIAWAMRFDAPFAVLGPEAFTASVPGFAARLGAARQPDATSQAARP
ncbi:helix-turn-helix transcriptional regulator [Arthrobacter sunyaminii]|uniref:WYL domain-containing protein n=1 Tax=Arthrobacter sunyaminii TaxID=2816859 RepID=A0A975S5J8_9MICC|nr:WYL domain-containing protein [Arthrobacter sunyaminii]MBO0909558.1 WYL domain-containing protein [Arthrobacter sunyaminii]QWQ36132.1 WYL domain-containing protein [Arthrobacter sunyaminii]